MTHEMQHPAGPTWCVNCGRFDVYCAGECEAEPTGKYDARSVEGLAALVLTLAGPLPARPAAPGEDRP